MKLKDRFAEMSKEDHREEAAQLARKIVKQVAFNLVVGALTTLAFAGISAGVNALASAQEEIKPIED